VSTQQHAGIRLPLQAYKKAHATLPLQAYKKHGVWVPNIPLHAHTFARISCAYKTHIREMKHLWHPYAILLTALMRARNRGEGEREGEEGESGEGKERKERDGGGREERRQEEARGARERRRERG